MTWTARLALLGVESSDLRWLDPAGEWHLTLAASLLYRRTSGQLTTVGTVTHLAAGPGSAVVELRAFGTVADPDIAEEMRSGRLHAEMCLDETTVTYDETGLVRFHAGTIVYVLAGTHPVWPDTHFTLGN